MSEVLPNYDVEPASDSPTDLQAFESQSTAAANDHSVSLNNPSPAPESTESIAQTADECSYDSQTPKPVMVYSCGATSDPQLATVAVDILYEYDLFISRKINANDAVQEIKNKIMLDLGTF